ncbi:MAG: PAS domain-containing protein, partial [Chitinophagaceae bacterium]
MAAGTSKKTVPAVTCAHTPAMLHLHPEQTLINQLFDAQPDSVLWFTPLFSNNNDSIPNDFEVRYCNRKAAQFLNSTPEAVFGARLSNSPMMDEATRRRIFDQCLAVWMNSESMEFNYHSPGHDRYYNVQRSKVNGGVLSITRDRTQEMQAERAHALQEQRYRQILDTAADGILVFEAERVEGNIVDFQVTHANRRAFQIGALPPDAVGRSLLQLFPHLRGSEQFERHCRVVESGTPQQFETSFRRPDGSEYGWFIVSLTRLGEGLVSNFVDVT